MSIKKNDKKASSIPEYLLQQQLEQKLNQSYNKMLLALSINTLAVLDQQISESEKTS